MNIKTSWAIYIPLYLIYELKPSTYTSLFRLLSTLMASTFPGRKMEWYGTISWIA
jgi:hypothetical protein